MSELTDAVIQLLGYRVGLVAVLLIIADGLQTRYLAGKVDDVKQDVGHVRDRVERVEDVHFSADGGENQNE